MGSKFDRSERQPLRTRGNIVLAFEGFSSEPKYFNKIKRSRMFPNSKLTPIVLKRDESKVEESHPKQVMEYLRIHKEWIESNDGLCPVDIFLTNYLSKIARNYPDLKKDLYHENKNKKKNEPKYPQFEDSKDELQRQLQSHNLILSGNKVCVEESLVALNSYMEEKRPGYEFDKNLLQNMFDKPCNFGENYYFMVVDRDQESFTLNDVQAVLRGCSEMNCKLILTSPCFELWVAMHFEEYRKVDMLEYVREYVYEVYYIHTDSSKEFKQGIGL